MMHDGKFNEVLESREKLFLELELSNEQEQRLRVIMAKAATAGILVVLDTVKDALSSGLDVLDGEMEAAYEAYLELS